MRLTTTLLAVPAILGCVAGCGDDAPVAHRASAQTTPGAPIEVALEPAHHSGVSGTARLVPARHGLKVILTLDKRIRATLPAHIHTGPCSKEPTAANPRIWVGLNELIGGRSQSEVVLATLPELQAESSSINVHDPAHSLRPLVCGDIPQKGGS